MCLGLLVEALLLIVSWFGFDGWVIEAYPRKNEVECSQKISFPLQSTFFQLTSKGEGACVGEGDEDGEGGRQEGVDHRHHWAALPH